MDFSNISDDQLLQLIQAAMKEAAKRGGAIAYAANRVMLDAETELRIKTEAARRAAEEDNRKQVEQVKKQTEAELQKFRQEEERQKQADLWARKAAVIAALVEDPLFQKDGNFQVNVWERSGDLRVYLQELGKGRGGWEVAYYRTGNHSYPPGTVTGVKDETRPRMVRFFELICSHWDPGFKVAKSDIASHVQPDEQRLELYRNALKKEETADV